MGMITKTLVAGGVVAAILYLPQLEKVNNYMQSLLEDLNFGNKNQEKQITPEMPDHVKQLYESSKQTGYRIKKECLKTHPNMGVNPVKAILTTYKTMDEIPAGVPRECIFSVN
jgi:hypothetical protein